MHNNERNRKATEPVATEPNQQTYWQDIMRQNAPRFYHAITMVTFNAILLDLKHEEEIIDTEHLDCIQLQLQALDEIINHKKY